MVNKAVSGGTLFNPARLVKFLNAGTKSLTTDPGLAQAHATSFRSPSRCATSASSKVQFLIDAVPSYAPDPNRLAPAPEREEAVAPRSATTRLLSKQFTSGAAKASQGEPGARPARQEAAPDPVRRGGRRTASAPDPAPDRRVRRGSVWRRRTPRPRRGRRRRGRCRRPWTTWAAVALPRTAACAGVRPSATPSRKPALNASPHPVVSTTSTSNAGDPRRCRSAVATSAPSRAAGHRDAADARGRAAPPRLPRGRRAPVKPSSCSSLGRK